MPQKRQLILLGGPPAVGKTSALRHLEVSLPETFPNTSFGLIDADDVWRGNLERSHITIGNVIEVARGYFKAGAEVVVVSWVFARPDLYQPFLDELADSYDSARRIYLSASPEVITERFLNRSGESRESSKAGLDYALQKHAEIEQETEAKIVRIDTSGLSLDDVATALTQTILT